MACHRSATIPGAMLRSVSAVAVMAAALCPRSSVAQPCSGMTGPQHSPIGSALSDVATGDFNGDGIPDVVTPSHDAKLVVVALGQGNGLFTTSATYTLRLPIHVAVGDLNADGRKDIVVVADLPGRVVVLLGVGDGTFTRTDLPVTGLGYGMAVADLNGDGRDDVAVARVLSTSMVSVLISASDGTLAAPIDSPLDSIPRTLASRDLNGDGLADLLVGKNSALSVLLASGGGRFRPAVNYPIATPNDIAFGDFDEDSRIDVMAASGAGLTLTLLPGNGDSTLAAATTFNAGAYLTSIATADFNGDGHVDVAVTSDTGPAGIFVYLGTGAAGFTGVAQYSGLVDPISAAVADLNGDGAPDVVVADFKSGAVSSFLNGGCWTAQHLDVTRSGSGSGRVSSRPSGIDCGPACSSDFVAGTQVTLLATAESGSGFTGWLGDCSGGQNSCSVSMDGPHSVTATFGAFLPPTIDGFTPGGGTIGTNVTITGTNLSWITSVAFNDTVASFVLESNTRMTAQAPRGASTGPIRVTSPYGSGTSASSFELPPPPVFVVTTTADSGPGSLREAIQAANATEVLDYVEFAIPGPGIHDILLASPLELTELTVVDGKSQPGYAGAPRIYVSGNGVVSDVFRLGGNSSGSTLQGLGITGFAASGVLIAPASEGNWIQENWIGFRRDDDGTAILNSATAIGSRGVSVQSQANIIRLNAIAGVDDGIVLGDDVSEVATPVATNAIQYNSIGTDPWGSTAAGYGNRGNGVVLGARARNLYVGPANVISGNALSGVTMYNAGNTENWIFRNRIGLDAYGQYVIGNGEFGVGIAGNARFNTVGGDLGGNVIAGNRLGGVVLGMLGRGATNENRVWYNTIGMNAGQTYGLGAQRFGVAIGAGARWNRVQSNVIGGSLRDGVHITDCPFNYASGNWIGRSAAGSTIQNWAYGVRIVNSANTDAGRNAFGTNVKGNTLLVNSPGSYIGTASRPLPVPDATAAPPAELAGGMPVRRD
jgi:hypothetical protein